MVNVVIPDDVKQYMRGNYVVEEHENLISIKEKDTKKLLYEIVDIEDCSRLIVLTDSQAQFADSVTVILLTGVPALHIKNGDLKLLIYA